MSTALTNEAFFFDGVIVNVVLMGIVVFFVETRFLAPPDQTELTRQHV